MREYRGWICFGLCLAFPVLLACLPATGWIVKANFRTLVGLPQWEKLGLKEGDHAFAVSAGDFYDVAPDGADHHSRLTAFGYVVDEVDLEKQYDTLRANWNDRHFLAAFVLQSCTFARIPVRRNASGGKGFPEETDRAAGAKSGRRIHWIQMREACDQGARIDPGNAFFPALSAAASDALDEPARVRASLAQAGRCSLWNDYEKELDQVYRRALRNAFGYRGEVAVVNWVTRGYLARQHLHGLAAGISRLPFDQVGIGARRDILRVAELAYVSAASIEAIEVSARIINRVAWYGPAHEMSQDEARATLLRYIRTTCTRVQPKNPLSLESRLREMVAAQDFRAAMSLGPSWEANPTPEWDNVEPSWWYRFTSPESAGQTAGLYSVATLSIAMALMLVMLVLSLLRATPPQFGLPQLFKRRVKGLAGATFVVTLMFVVVASMVRFPFLSWPIWIAITVVPVLLAVTIISTTQWMTWAETANIGRRFAAAFLGAAVVVYGFGVIWQSGVNLHRLQRMGDDQAGAIRARQWAHDHPNGVDRASRDVWWQGA